MYEEKLPLSTKIKKMIVPTKWGMCKFFFKVGIFAIASTYYFGAIHNQMKKDENSTLFGSIEDVLKNQYDAIKDPFLSLLKRAEGYQNGFYADNKGYAVGYGYNPTQNSKEYNKSILDYAGVDENTKAIILKNADKYKNQNGGKVPQEFKDAKFTKEQLDKMAVYSQQSYERSFFRVLNHKLDNKNIEGVRRTKILKAYVDLPENKKAVLIHMAYKVGETNLEKYNNFFNNFINYLENPTNSNKEAVAQSFTYKYAKNGVMLHDTRVEKMHHDLFIKDMPKKELIVENKTVDKADKNKLTEQEKFNKAMKEVNQQITFNGALELLVKAANKINEKLPQNYNNGSSKKVQPIMNNEEQYEDDTEEPGEYYESSSDVQQIIVNGQKITVQNGQNVQVISNGTKVSVKIR